jgi:hypothetical protein
VQFPQVQQDLGDLLVFDAHDVARTARREHLEVEVRVRHPDPQLRGRVQRSTAHDDPRRTGLALAGHAAADGVAVLGVR